MGTRAEARKQLADAMDAPRKGIWRRNPVLSFLFLLADMLLHMERRNEAQFAYIERMEHKIMADETKINADLTSMGNDLTEIQSGIAALNAALAAGNTQAAQDEADKISALLDPLTANVRTAASQFDPAAPPAPAPDAAKKHGHK